jgi:hypothetical protein
MNNRYQSSFSTTSRRGFFAGAAVLGLGINSPMPQILTRPDAPDHSPEQLKYEHLLATTDQLEQLGIPRTWSVVEQRFHPFHPDRIAVLPSGAKLRYPDFRSPGARSRIIGRITQHGTGVAGGCSDLPSEKLESYFWMMDLITNHYQTPELFEEWTVGLGQRENLMTSAFRAHWGMVHQFQTAHDAPVDCPPMDWWLFLFPDGVDWASMSEEPVHALIAQVGQQPFPINPGRWLRVMELTQRVTTNADNGKIVSQMGPAGAARYLNGVIADLMVGA